jgi:hypothetical protein
MSAEKTQTTIARLVLTVLFVFATTAWAETADSTVTCKDGSTSKGGRGACRGHGGVDKSKTAGETAAAPAESATPTAASEATVVCKDGTTSKGGRGACHGHGGVDKTKSVSSGGQPPAAAPASSAPTSAPPPTPVAMPRPTAAPHAAASPATETEKVTKGKAATDDPVGAIAKCKDGKYWHGAKHSGSCSHHGGVDTWLDGSQK